MSEPECECGGAGFCKRYNRYQDEYRWGICRGIYGEGKGKAYREKWAREVRAAAEQPQPLHVLQSTPEGERIVRVNQPVRKGPQIVPVRPHARTPEEELGPGPGWEIHEMFRSLGFRMGSCGCMARAKKMNEWGVKGCRIPENREQILRALRNEQKRAGWGDKIKAGVLAVVTGLVAVIDPLDPAPGLYDEAVRRAEAKEVK